jgi:hypothetical protein
MLPTVLTVVLLAACGGGGDDDDSTRYRAVSMTGTAIDFHIDTRARRYSYAITHSASGLSGSGGSGSLEPNADGTFTPSGVQDSRVATLPSGLMLGAVQERVGSTVATMPFIGLRDGSTTRTAIAAKYNYVHRGCTSDGQCDASFGTLQVDADGSWTTCRGSDLSDGVCAGVVARGALVAGSGSDWQMKAADGTEIGVATGFESAGQKLLVVKLKDARSGGFGSGMLIGGQQAPMTREVADGSYVAGMNNGTWFQFTGQGEEVRITHLNFQPVELSVSVTPNLPWTGMTTTAWGEIGFISAAGLYMLMTPAGDLELGVKLR